MMDVLALYYSIPGEFLATALFYWASFLSDPLCWAHESYRFSQATGGGGVWVGISIIFWIIIAIITILPSMICKAIAISMQTVPYLYSPSLTTSKELTDPSFTLLSWNLCFVAGGYSISDGGVMPWRYRIDPIIEELVEKNADVNCLYEIFDTKAAFYLKDALQKKGYHCYFNVGPKVVGVSSGIFVASKYKIVNPSFTPFPKESLVGRTKAAAKGVFSFDLCSRNSSFATIHATHLQHSELPEYPTLEEVAARELQMEIIMNKIDRTRCVLVTGDLNLDDEEYLHSSWKVLFEKNDLFREKTWGGDAFCAALMGKKRSNSLNLDHTLLFKGSAKQIRTLLIPTGYDDQIFKEEALSDHAGLLTQVSLH